MVKINKELIPLKAHYFFFNAGTAPLYPTMPVYAKQLGYSSFVVGTIYTIFPICGVIAKPFIGAVGDAWRSHKTLLLIFEILIMTSYFGIQFVPGIPQTKDPPVLDVLCGANSTFKLCPHGAREFGMMKKIQKDDLTAECEMHCSIPTHLKQENCDLCVHGVPSPNRLAREVDRKVPHIHPTHSRFTAVLPLRHSYLDGSCYVIPIAQTNDSQKVMIAPQCLEPSTVSCVSVCTLRPLQRLLRESANADIEVTRHWQFWLWAALLAISWIGTTISVSLTDTVCVEILGRQSRQFGNQRLFGSTGWGLLAVASGLIVDAFSDGTEVKNYTPAFYLMLISMVPDLVATHFMKYEQTTVKSRNIFKDVGHLFLNARVVVFMIWCTFIGVCFGMIWNFLFWYMEEIADLQGGNALTYIKTIEGLVGGVQCFLGEVPSYYLSGWVLARIGHGHAMSLVLFLAGVRFMLYSVISDPWWVLPVSVLQCMNGLFFPTMTSYAKIVAEPGTEATVQGLVSALCEGVGVALGSFLGGLLVKLYGAAATFRIFGIAALVMTVFNVIAQWLLERFYKSNKGLSVEQNEKTKFDVVST